MGEESVDKKTNIIVKIITFIIAFFLLLILIVIKINRPTFPLIWVIIISVVIIILGIGIFYSIEIFNLIKNKLIKREKTEKFKLPQPITAEQAREMIDNFFINKHQLNHIKLDDEYNDEYPISVGKNVRSLIYVFKRRLLYGNRKVCVLVNMHYPTERFAFLNEPTETQIRNVAESLGVEPSEKPDIEEVEVTNPILGVTQKTTKVIHKKESEEERKKKEGDLE